MGGLGCVELVSACHVISIACIRLSIPAALHPDKIPLWCSCTGPGGERKAQCSNVSRQGLLQPNPLQQEVHLCLVWKQEVEVACCFCSYWVWSDSTCPSWLHFGVMSSFYWKCTCDLWWNTAGLRSGCRAHHKQYVLQFPCYKYLLFQSQMMLLFIFHCGWRSPALPREHRLALGTKLFRVKSGGSEFLPSFAAGQGIGICPSLSSVVEWINRQ